MDTSSPDLVALLAACRARPADDLPRLVLADWLDENGQPERAEFVRVQVELSHQSADAERTAALRAAEQQLLETHYEEWGGGLDKALSDIGYSDSGRSLFWRWRSGKSEPWKYPRGLLTLNSVPDLKGLNQPRVVSWFLSPAARWLERVNLTFGPDEFVKAELPDELHGKLSLTLKIDARGSDTAVARQCRQFALSSNYTALRSVETNGVNGLAIVEQITSAEVSHLVQLTVPCGSEAERAASHIASAPLTSLSSLDLGPLTELALKALMRSPYLGNLTELYLIGSPIGDAGMVALCGSRLAHTLRAVEFPNTGIGDAGVIALVRSPLFAHMHGPRLNLMMNRIGDEGLKAIAGSEHLLRFRELVLKSGFGGDPSLTNRIGDEGVIALTESPHAANLQFLDFSRNRLTDRGAFALARSPHLKQVIDLCVKENGIGAAGAAALHERFGEAAKV